MEAKSSSQTPAAEITGLPQAVARYFEAMLSGSNPTGHKPPDQNDGRQGGKATAATDRRAVAKGRERAAARAVVGRHVWP